MITFLKEAKAELGKVVWPTRRRTVRLTVIVVIVTILFAAFIGMVDYGLDRGLQAVLDITGGGGGPRSGEALPLEQIPGGTNPNPAPAEAPK